MSDSSQTKVEAKGQTPSTKAKKSTKDPYIEHGKKIDALIEVADALIAKVQRLESALAKMAHMSGNHAIMIEHKIEPFIPGQQDMSKFKT